MGNPFLKVLARLRLVQVVWFKYNKRVCLHIVHGPHPFSGKMYLKDKGDIHVLEDGGKIDDYQDENYCKWKPYIERRKLNALREVCNRAGAKK